MGMLPDQVRSMSGADYANFVALYTDDPWGSERDNAHTALLLAQQASIYKPKGSPPVNPNKYMLGRHRTDRTDKSKISELKAHMKAGFEQQKKQAQDDN